MNVCDKLKSHALTSPLDSCYSPGGIDEVYYKRCYTENEN